MKSLKAFVFAILCIFSFSCNKSGSSSTPSTAMSATVNGSAISFTSSFTNSNGYTIMTGTSSTYSIQLYLKLTGGGGTFTLSDPSTNNYATVSNSFATYTTSSGSPGYAYVTQGSNGLYNGTFYFSATNGQTVSVSNGSFSNM